MSNDTILFPDFIELFFEISMYTTEEMNPQWDSARKFGFPLIVYNVYQHTDSGENIAANPFRSNDAFDDRSGITEGKRGGICELFPFNSTRDLFHVAPKKRRIYVF